MKRMICTALIGVSLLATVSTAAQGSPHFKYKARPQQVAKVYANGGGGGGSCRYGCDGSYGVGGVLG